MAANPTEANGHREPTLAEFKAEQAQIRQRAAKDLRRKQNLLIVGLACWTFGVSALLGSQGVPWYWRVVIVVAAFVGLVVTYNVGRDHGALAVMVGTAQVLGFIDDDKPKQE